MAATPPTPRRRPRQRSGVGPAGDAAQTRARTPGRFAARIDGRHGHDWVFEAPALICSVGDNAEIGVAGGAVTSWAGVEEISVDGRLWLRAHPEIVARLTDAQRRRQPMTLRVARHRPDRLQITCRDLDGELMFGWDIPTGGA